MPQRAHTHTQLLLVSAYVYLYSVCVWQFATERRQSAGITMAPLVLTIFKNSTTDCSEPLLIEVSIMKQTIGGRKKDNESTLLWKLGLNNLRSLLISVIHVSLSSKAKLGFTLSLSFKFPSVYFRSLLQLHTFSAPLCVIETDLQAFLGILLMFCQPGALNTLTLLTWTLWVCMYLSITGYVYGKRKNARPGFWANIEQTCHVFFFPLGI